MSIFDEIAKGGTARPIAAFMVGREQKRQRERQEQIDTLNEESQGVVNDLRRAQTAALKAPKAPELDADVSEFMQVTRTPFDDPQFGEKFVAYKQSLKGPQSVTNVNLPAAENAGNKVLLQEVAKGVVKSNQEAAKTHEADAELTRMQLALSRGAQTGTGERIILTGRKALETLGIADLPEDAKEQEVFDALSARLALIARNPESGLGLPGSTSNKDLDFLERIVPGLSKSEGGNMLIIETVKRTNKMKRDVAAERMRLINSHGGVYMGLDSDIARFASDYELFTDEERAQMESAVIKNVSAQERLGSIFDDPETTEVFDDIMSR